MSNAKQTVENGIHHSESLNLYYGQKCVSVFSISFHFNSDRILMALSTGDTACLRVELMALHDKDA
jgi:hypothetical protein